MPERLYLDHAATTPTLPAVREAMSRWIDAGNPSSLHEDGRKAKLAIDEAREVLSGSLKCLFAEVLFTSGGTESANMAIVGAALANQDSRRNRVLMTAVEHHCVLHTRPTLERLGYTVELVAVGRDASVNLEDLQRRLGDDVLLVCTMHANNELGTVNPIRDVAELAMRSGALVHCDAVQTFLSPFHPIPSELGADLLTVSAHKVHGPKGAGAIYIRAGVKLKPLIAGGGQEREMRGGTENVAAIVGFGEAVRALATENSAEKARDVFVARLVAGGAIPSINDYSRVLPGHAHVRFPGIDAETMLIRLDRAGISASSGSACSSGSVEASHVLLACGYPPEEAKEGLRFTFGRYSTIEEAEQGAEIVIRTAQKIWDVRNSSRFSVPLRG